MSLARNAADASRALAGVVLCGLCDLGERSFSWRGEGSFLAESAKSAKRGDPVGVCPVALAFLVGSVLSGERRAS